jgi:BirA family transcriptional regulator, biotin operon repressor / biotin---[acetyl-CoA-carboxylase] ligase
MKNFLKTRQIIKIATLDSTNTYAATLPKDLAEGTIIWALDQTAGRGQADNKWESEPGKNLTFSIILHPTFLSPIHQFYLSKVISLAVVDFVALFTDNVSIKWPNDIYVVDKKIAGILIENAIEGETISQSVAGIGININQQKFSAYAPNPLSLKQLTNKEFDLEEMLDLQYDLIAYRYSLLKENKLKIIDENYHDALYQLNVTKQYLAYGKIFSGNIVGVEANGTLLICDESKKIHKFLHKEVEYLF